MPVTTGQGVHLRFLARDTRFIIRTPLASFWRPSPERHRLTEPSQSIIEDTLLGQVIVKRPRIRGPSGPSSVAGHRHRGLGDLADAHDGPSGPVPG